MLSLTRFFSCFNPRCFNLHVFDVFADVVGFHVPITKLLLIWCN